MILEVAIPLASLAVETDDPVQFFVEADRKPKQAIDRLPHEGAIETTRPFARVRTHHVAGVTMLQNR